VAGFAGLVRLGANESLTKEPEKLAALEPKPLATKLKLSGSYGGRSFRSAAQNVLLGSSIMFGAGTLSGLLGIGSGAVKILAIDNVMKLPFRVSTTTSNFMIGVTAAASAGIYLFRGYIDPGIAMPVMLLVGSLVGARILERSKATTLKVLFSLVIVALGIAMIYSGLRGRF
jgi:uncharacterized protein